MIRLTKTAEPHILLANRAAWSRELEAAVATGQPVPRHYAHPQIREALRAETHSKCAYCEAHILSVTWEHIDHILPKTARPDLALDWTNLTIACPRCNQHKGTYYSIQIPLLDPYVDDPEEHLAFLGPLVHGRTIRGLITVQRLRLNRAGLLEPKAERIGPLDLLWWQWSRETDAEVKEFLGSVLRAEVEASREYAATARAHLGFRGFPF